MTRLSVRTPTAPESPATGGVEILELPLEPIDRARAVLEAGGSPRAMIEAFERGGALPSRVIEAQASIELSPMHHQAAIAGAPRPHPFGEGPVVFETTIPLEAPDADGKRERVYRWQVEVIDEGTRERVVAMWRRPAGWRIVVSPATLEFLLAMTPAEHRMARR